ncbi:MAG: hypothetical protein AVDCRST_MAG02-4779 [uncultured Rubrobacteraceae bacterium]|uniref:Uncharacterized protein n=1 Tax=uncultured Rubrobacteraceae bacterium TaxID=349277 RepID=A0A6J4S4M9_9ACTN|nr:MAG: hypothetical protein AVDCRST_MAG02-4779 [uncultured Rubrobacteraceae bacterium]
MGVESPPSFRGLLPIKLEQVRRWLNSSRIAGGDPTASRGFLTPEEFQQELVVLGLSDRQFGSKEYASALGKHLGLSVSIDIVPDATHPLLSRELARKGVTGEIRYRADLARAQIIVPGSLPPLALIFTVLHELGHLAAGDLFVDTCQASLLCLESPAFPTLEVPNERRLAQRAPFAQPVDREHEADLRAGYAFVAGCLGSENPYAQRMYDIL